jgi:hypothetical protein
MNKHFFLMTMAAAAIAVSGNAQNTPRYAASTHTWVFGEQTWSDAIQGPACNKESFEDGDTTPQCRSYTEDGETFYYYNWAYVDAYKSRMCPAPWRVPTKSDFETLVFYAGASTLISEWGYGGYANGSSVTDETSYAYYWSCTESASSGIDGAYFLSYYSGDLLVTDTYKGNVFQVRCVR